MYSWLVDKLIIIPGTMYCLPFLWDGEVVILISILVESAKKDDPPKLTLRPDLGPPATNRSRMRNRPSGMPELKRIKREEHNAANVGTIEPGEVPGSPSPTPSSHNSDEQSQNLAHKIKVSVVIVVVIVTVLFVFLLFTAFICMWKNICLVVSSSVHYIIHSILLISISAHR